MQNEKKVNEVSRILIELKVLVISHLGRQFSKLSSKEKIEMKEADNIKTSTNNIYLISRLFEEDYKNSNKKRTVQK